MIQSKGKWEKGEDLRNWLNLPAITGQLTLTLWDAKLGYERQNHNSHERKILLVMELLVLWDGVASD